MREDEFEMFGPFKVASNVMRERLVWIRANRKELAGKLDAHFRKELEMFKRFKFKPDDWVGRFGRVVDPRGGEMESQVDRGLPMTEAPEFDGAMSAVELAQPFNAVVMRVLDLLDEAKTERVFYKGKSWRLYEKDCPPKAAAAFFVQGIREAVK